MDKINQSCQGEATATIKQYATRLRTSLRIVYGEAHFAKLCVEFDKKIMPDGSIKDYGEVEGVRKETIETLFRYASVLRLLAFNTEALIVQLALIWLDGHDWGEMTLIRLSELIVEAREVYKLENATQKSALP